MATTHTVRNLDAYVGDVVTISNGEFMVSPWSYKMPTTSKQFEINSVPNGIYRITAKTPDSQEEGAGVNYIITSDV